MKKGDFSVTQLGIIVSLSVAFVVLLWVTGAFGDFLKSTGEKNLCAWNLVSHAFTRTPILGTVNIPAECEMEKIEVTMSMLNKGTKKAGKKIKEFTEEEKYRDSVEYFRTKSNSVFQEKLELEYAMDKIIADQMRSCWLKAWRGQLPLFDEWWKLLGWKEEGDAAEDRWISQYLPEFKGPPTFCLICGRIKFEDDVSEKFPDEITSLNEWMQNHQVLIDQKQKRSYYEFILGDQYYERNLILPIHKYNTLEPQAVIFKRINVFKASQWANRLIKRLSFGSLGDDSFSLNSVRLIPFANLNDNEECTYTIG